MHTFNSFPRGVGLYEYVQNETSYFAWSVEKILTDINHVNLDYNKVLTYL